MRRVPVLRTAPGGIEMNPVYRAAIALASRGVPVFPCRSNEKAPATGLGGFHNASTDPEQIRRWFCGPANLAIPTGLRSGLFVVDVDRHVVDGVQTLGQLELALGALPATTTVRTAGGGQHRYFKCPEHTPRNSAGRLGPGVDTRGEGGYVLAPPSRIDGRHYEWDARVAPAELPAAWIAALSPRERPSDPVEPWSPRDDRDHSRAAAWCTRALQEEARELAATPSGARNDRLWRCAAALGGLAHAGGISAEDIRRALLWACSQWDRRSPGKDAQTLENGLAFGLAHPRPINLGDTRAA